MKTEFIKLSTSQNPLVISLKDGKEKPLSIVTDSHILSVIDGINKNEVLVSGTPRQINKYIAGLSILHSPGKIWPIGQYLSKVIYS